MIRLSKLADYGLVLISCFTAEPKSVLSCRQLAARAMLPLPTVAKVLKALGRAGLLTSQRGQAGGYRLARRPDEITVVDVIAAVEGPIRITACSAGAGPRCRREAACPGRTAWQRINQTVVDALNGLSLERLNVACPPPNVTPITLRSLTSP